MHRYYFFEALFILLAIALVATIIRYPKDVLVKLPLGLLKRIYRNIWPISLPLEVLEYGETDDDKPYKSIRRLKVDFREGEKYFYIITSNADIREIINGFLEALTERHSIEHFKIADSGDKKIIQLPKNINFYDYHLLVQHLNGELGDKKGFGVYKSDKLQYFVFQDSETLNNLVGFTSDQKYFSIYMLDDLKKEQCLRLNQKLRVETDWIKL